MNKENTENSNLNETTNKCIELRIIFFNENEKIRNILHMSCDEIYIKTYSSPRHLRLPQLRWPQPS